MTATANEVIASAHPLDPLSAGEVDRAWAILREERRLGPEVRVIFIMLRSPAASGRS